MYISGDKHLAEELLQETYYQAIKSIYRLGKWAAVDFVKSPEQFNPDNIPTDQKFFVKEMTFLKNGELKEVFAEVNKDQMEDTHTPWLSWIKNYVINKGGDQI